jgi:aminoacyl-tRNA hydrolase
MPFWSKFAPQRWSDALAWRFRNLVGDQRLDRAIVKAAHTWRPYLHKPVFIGIAGSAGKTTTKELLHGVLSYHRHGLSNPSSLNALPEVAKVVLRLRPGHDFCIAELSEDKPGIMDAPLALLQPSIGIVTVIGNDHLSAFGSRGDIADEVGKLVAALPAQGTAVLNADDEAVLAMANGCIAKVITYGTSPKASLRAEDVQSAWPDRLQMTLVWGAERVALRTQLCGTHWLPAVLGAIGGGLAAGLALDDCTEAIAGVAPFDGRMQPVTTADGVTFIRDDFKAPVWTIAACFEFMKAARAKRKIVVIGELSDIRSEKGKKYEQAAIRAQEISDIAVFVGPWAFSALKAHRHEREDALRAFGHVRDASEYINSIARDGDLILLKGSETTDHLLRILLARTQEIACWRDDCRQNCFCNLCDHRMKPSGAALLMQRQRSGSAAPQAGFDPADRVEPGAQVIVGLGNPEAKYAGTPHNIGYELVDLLATDLGLTWSTFPQAWIARGELAGQPVCLIKSRLAMNATGAGLKQLSTRMGFDPEQCLLILDDLDLPVGTVKTRQHGGAGGHRGVASILEAFQTDAIRRIKVGVGQVGLNLKRGEYVLTPFDAGSRVAVDTALSTATTRLRVMLALNVAQHGASPAKV